MYVNYTLYFVHIIRYYILTILVIVYIISYNECSYSVEYLIIFIVYYIFTLMHAYCYVQ